MKIDFKTYSNIDIDKELEKHDFSKLGSFFENHSNYTGWLNSNLNLEKTKEKGNFFKKECDILLVVGIGGSYLGAKAIIDALSVENKVEILFVGNTLSTDALVNVKKKIENKRVGINYISKSGETLETRIIFNELMKVMKIKYSDDELKKRVVYTTGNKEIVPSGYDYFLIPDNIGGRYSVFTAVGFLPIYVAGIDVDNLYLGSQSSEISEDVKKYAIFRKKMQDDGKKIEAYVTYNPKLFFLIEWIKQLYAESLGKEGQGIFPVGLINTTDLHSIGQFMQEGSKITFETVINFEEKKEIYIDEYSKYLSEINEIAQTSTSKAHYEAEVPNIIINNGELNAKNLGYLMKFLMMSCAVSGYLENINPFNQEGVQVYKKEMLDKLV